MYSTLKLCKYY